MTNSRWPWKQSEHEDIVERLSAYLDNQVTERERAHVEAHLKGCEACRQELVTLRWTKRLLRAAPLVPAPRSFIVREADVVRQRSVRPRALLATQWATAAVALLFMVVLTGDLLTGLWTMGRPMMAAREGRSYGAAAPQEQTQVTEQAALPTTGEIQDESHQAQGQADALASSTPAPPAEVMLQAEEKPQLETEGETGTNLAVTATPTALVEAQKAAPTTRAAAMASPTPLPAPVEPMPTPTPPTEPLATDTPTPTPPAELLATDTPAPAPPAMAAAPAPTAAPEPLQLQVLEQPRGETRHPTRALWRITEVGLGLALVGLAVAVILLRRHP